ncbi:hypothetical protein ACLOJK_017954 [Asimina triloba]
MSGRAEPPNPRWLSWRSALFSDGSLLLALIGDIVPEIDDWRSNGHDRWLGCMAGPDFAYEAEDLAATENGRFSDGFSSVIGCAGAKEDNHRGGFSPDLGRPCWRRQMGFPGNGGTPEPRKMVGFPIGGSSGTAALLDFSNQREMGFFSDYRSSGGYSPEKMVCLADLVR